MSKRKARGQQSPQGKIDIAGCEFKRDYAFKKNAESRLKILPGNRVGANSKEEPEPYIDNDVSSMIHYIANYTR